MIGSGLRGDSISLEDHVRSILKLYNIPFNDVEVKMLCDSLARILKNLGFEEPL